MKRIFLLAACLTALELILSPQARAAGTVAAEFLRFPVGPAAGMSEASGSVTQDATALYWNPAGLGAMESVAVYAAHTSLPMTLRHDFAAVVLPLHGLHIPAAIGASIQALTQSPIAALDNTGAPAGTYNTSDTAQTAAFATHIGGFRIGAAVRMVRQSLADVSGTAAVGSVGVQNTFNEVWDAGASLSNVGDKLRLGSQSEPLPRTGRAGIGCHLFDNDLLIAGDVSHVQSSGLRGHFGAQYRLYPARKASQSVHPTEGVCMRAGYTAGNKRDDAISGISWGIGLGYRSFRADFAYQAFGDLGNLLQFGLGCRF
jgi:hypothetical protein